MVTKTQSPVFLAISAYRSIKQNRAPIPPLLLQGLSPQVMAWSSEIWIVDMSSVMPYWRHVAGQLGITLVETWVQVLLGMADTSSFLQRKTGDRIASVEAMQQFTIAGASSAWQAVVLLTSMLNRNMHGVVLHFPPGRASESFGYIDWDSWWQCVAEVKSRWQSRQIKGFVPATFNRHAQNFRTALKRLNCHTPAKTLSLNKAGIQRRFGQWIALLWEWTLTNGTVTDTSAFPWQTERFAEKIRHTRLVEYPLTMWQWILPLLQHDLDQLTAKALVANQTHVLQVSLIFQLDNHSTHTIDLCFRHPHDLRSQVGEHVTLCAQAHQQFEAWRLTYDRQNPDLDITPGIGGWTLTIEQHLQVTPVLLELFGGATTLQTQLETLCQIENDLPIALTQFDYTDDWMPDYSAVEVGHHPLPSLTESQTDHRPSLSALALHRPLYLLPEPTPVLPPDQRLFLESITTPWWRAQHPIQARTYYRARLSDGRWGWIYQDENLSDGIRTERWLLQGLYL